METAIQSARLEAVVEAYRAALEERMRARVPLDWAATQNNLGNAFATLGERESETATRGLGTKIGGVLRDRHRPVSTLNCRSLPAS